MKMEVLPYLSGTNNLLERVPTEPETRGDPNQFCEEWERKDRELGAKAHVFSELRGHHLENLHFPLS